VAFKKSDMCKTELCRHRRMLFHVSNTWQLYAVTVIVGLHCIFILTTSTLSTILYFLHINTFFQSASLLRFQNSLEGTTWCLFYFI
jgi:hypothetical protein